MKTTERDSFDLTKIYTSNSLFYSDIEQSKQLVTQLENLKGTLANSSDTLLTFLTLEEQFETVLSKAYTYAFLLCDVDPSNQDNQTMKATAMNLFIEANQRLTFVKTELCNNAEQITNLLSDSKLKNFKYKVQTILKYKPHILSFETEQLISQFDGMSGLSYKVYDAMRLEHDPVMINGKPHELNSATLFEFLKNPNPSIRKTAYQQFYSDYKKFENVFAATLSQQMDKDETYARIRNFDSALEASVFDDDVPSSLFFKVLEHANQTYRPALHDYFKLKKKVLNLQPFYNYDINIPLVSSTQQSNYTVDQAYEIIIEALKPLGPDYIETIKKSREEQWVDFYPKPNKRGGAYSSGSYDTIPYILMNYIGDYNSMSTLAHELGHSMHSYLSNKNQTATNASYKIFVAEVASIVNEVLLLRHMVENATTKQQKASLLYEHLENVVGTIYRQPMFADFEYKLHTLAKNKEPMSSKVITDLYMQLSKDYLGPSVTVHELTGHSCYYVPHFYYNYYVYKYTIGMTIALALVKRILENNDDTVEQYLKFLSSGGSASPIELLSIAGVNPLDDTIYHDAFTYFKDTLKEFESII